MTRFTAALLAVFVGLFWLRGIGEDCAPGCPCAAAVLKGASAGAPPAGCCAPVEVPAGPAVSCCDSLSGLVTACSPGGCGEASGGASACQCCSSPTTDWSGAVVTFSPLRVACPRILPLSLKFAVCQTPSGHGPDGGGCETAPFGRSGISGNAPGGFLEDWRTVRLLL